MTEILVVLLCLFINMVLSGSEMAFVTVNKQQLKEIAATNRNARRLLFLKENPERTLSVIQIGITVVGAVAAAVGGAGAGGALTPWLMEALSLSRQTAEAMAIVMVVLPISYLSVVVGELVPKTLALRNPLFISLSVAPGLFYGEKVLLPAVTVLEWSTNLVLRFFKIRGRGDANPAGEQIFIEDLPRQTKQYVINIVNAEKTLAREIMLPWSQVVSISKNDTMEQVEAKVVDFRHTRLPVVDGAEVVGLLHTKELLVAIRHGASEWQTLIRPILRFKSFDPLFRILLKMQEQKSHMAVIYDQVTPAGIVTMEDIFEEIIGDVFDEDDDGLVRKLLASKGRRRPV